MFNFKKMKVKSLFCAWEHCRSFLDFSLTFLPKRGLEYLTIAGNSSSAASVLWIQKKYIYICFVFFFRHFGSATQTCACFKCGKITATKAPAPGRKRFVSVDCGRIPSSSSSWKDQPAQTWCHSESAHVLHPGLTRRNQLGSGSDVLSWNHFSPNDRNEYRSYDECV